MFRIGFDAMGGDYAPSATVKGAIMALDTLGDDSRIVLFGDRGGIEAILKQENCSVDNFDIVHCSEEILMNDHPVQAFQSKPDSSIAVGFSHLKSKKIDGFVSAGNTGAMMVGCMYAVKQIEGVIRPAISVNIGTTDGKSMLLLDVGLNVDCKPEVLFQYGIIGSVYAKNVMKLENPRVALLNIGEEREKGNIVTRATYELMEQTDLFNFVGNIEAKSVLTGEVADVIVCDGFLGNSMLKQMEGFYEIAKSQGISGDYIEALNYATVGGTPVLGINGNVLIGHGCSSELAIKNMILQTELTIKGNLVDKLREIFS